MGVPLDALTELAQRAKSGTPDWFMPYRQAKATASILRCWSPLLVPGLLQTESYMRAVLSVEDCSAGQLDELVAARLERQTVVGRAYLTAVIDEHVVRRPVGSVAVMASNAATLRPRHPGPHWPDAPVFFRYVAQVHQSDEDMRVAPGRAGA
jgi:hypothetical protein